MKSSEGVFTCGKLVGAPPVKRQRNILHSIKKTLKHLTSTKSSEQEQ